VSSSSFAATVAPSVRIVPATAVARARVSGVRAAASAADRDSKVLAKRAWNFLRAQFLGRDCEQFVS
jgi:hypothetical protein